MAALMPGAILLSWWVQDQNREKWLQLHGLQDLQEYVCTNDCGLFIAGVDWAADEATSGHDCPRQKPIAFYQGCLAGVAYSAELRDLYERADSAGVEMNAVVMDPGDPEFMEERRRKKWGE